MALHGCTRSTAAYGALREGLIIKPDVLFQQHDALPKFGRKPTFLFSFVAILSLFKELSANLVVSFEKQREKKGRKKERRLKGGSVVLL